MSFNQTQNDTFSSGKLSYRQVGKTLGGQVIKGPIKPNFVERTTPSIPSKFETKINISNNERDAFGGRTQRFGMKRVRRKEIPLPV